MSAITQFFPQPGGSGGGGNIGGGTTPVEIIGVSGGGGAGGTYSHPQCPFDQKGGYGGSGGTGAIFYANNYFITPGTTYPITIGSGGVAGCPCASTSATAFGGVGTNGGATIFCNPLCTLCVAGGGGGGAGSYNNECCGNSDNNGRKGGTGGTGGNWNKEGPICCRNCRGVPANGMYYKTKLTYQRNLCAQGFLGTFPAPAGVFPVSEQIQTSSAQVLDTPWGWMGGFPAGPGYTRTKCPVAGGTCTYADTCGGGMMSNVEILCMEALDQYCQSPTAVECRQISLTVGGSARYYELNWGTCSLSLGNPCGIYNNCANSDGCIADGSTGGSGTPGGSGILMIRYPDQEAAATITGGTDISPETPGYRTYCFTSSGSITL